MRKLVLIFLINCLLLINNLYSNFNESFLIKRAFLDTIKIPPTPEEIEWFCVYENDSYESAVNWLINHKDFNWPLSKTDSKIILNSIEYKTFYRIPMSKIEIEKIILYLNGFGKDTEPNPNNIKLAYDKMIESALKCSFNEDETIDYIANLLMCRSTTAKELNSLKELYKKTNSWKEIIDHILQIDDAKTR